MSEAQQERIYARFMRQRRNLILSSLLIFFYKIGKLHLTELNILGNKITIGEPKVIFLCLVIFFFYFIWRYYTSCNEVRGIGEHRVRYKIFENKTAQQQGYKTFRNKTGIIDNFELKRIDPSMTFRVHVPSGFSREKLAIIKSIGDIHIKGVQRIKVYFKAWIIYILEDNVFSEYVFPYLLAIAAIAAIIWF